MSAVYLAKQTRPTRYVAIKVLLPNITIGSRVHNEFLLRFQHEANVIANLEHVNIVSIYEYNEQDKLAYLVMPYLAGGSLADLLAQRATLSLNETIAYINQAAAALDHAHAHGVIHRDLKPNNFLLHGDGRLVLADFGIARIMQGGSSPQGISLTLTGTILGTPDYMAPEMALGKTIDARTDVYELGIVLFQMLSGNVPFRGDGFFAIIEQHLQAPLPSLHQLNLAIPLAVDAVVQKAAAKRSEDRYPSAGALAQALNDATTNPNPHFAPTVAVLRPITPLYLRDVTNETTEPSKLLNQAPPSPYIPTQKVPLPAQKSRKRSALVFVGLMLALVLVGTGVFATFQIIASFNMPSQQGPSVQTPDQQAKNAVWQYYDNWNKGNYLAAYNLLDPDYQKGYTYNAAKSDYAKTKHSCITFGSVTSLPDGSMMVATTDNAIETSGTASTTNVYQGFWIAKHQQGVWRITPHISLVSTHGFCQN
jgi:serine/threonine protein kinase